MNASLSKLIADVYTLTNRPDLESETLLAIRAATLKAHRSDYYYKDIFETAIQFDFSLSQQSLDYKVLFPMWRSLKYVRPYDTGLYTGSVGRPLNPLTTITPEEILDTYSVTKENVCYVAGTQLQIRTRGNFQFFLIGFYINPNVTEENYNSWISDEHPMAIIYEAAAIIFKSIGFDEQNAAYRQLVLDEYSELKMANIIANGY